MSPATFQRLSRLHANPPGVGALVCAIAPPGSVHAELLEVALATGADTRRALALLLVTSVVHVAIAAPPVTQCLANVVSGPGGLGLTLVPELEEFRDGIRRGADFLLAAPPSVPRSDITEAIGPVPPALAPFVAAAVANPRSVADGILAQLEAAPLIVRPEYGEEARGLVCPAGRLLHLVALFLRGAGALASLGGNVFGDGERGT